MNYLVTPIKEVSTLSYAKSYDPGTIVEVDGHVRFLVCSTNDPVIKKQFVRLSVGDSVYPLVWPLTKGLVVTRIIGKFETDSVY